MVGHTVGRMFPIILLLTLSILTIPSAYAQTSAYPPPPPSNITVHSTTLTYSGPPTTQFTFNVTKIDNQSVVTGLSFTTSVPLSGVSIQVFQLSDFPSGITRATGVSLLIVQFNVLASVDQSITSATIDFKVSQSSISSAGVNPNSMVVQRFFQDSWSGLSTKVVQSNSQFVFLEAQSPGLSVYAITGTIPPTPFPWSLVISVVVIIAVVIVVGVLVVRRRQKTGS